MARSFPRDAQSLTFATPINLVKPLLAVKGWIALPCPPAAPPRPSRARLATRSTLLPGGDPARLPASRCGA
jgi:hypothetical protein